MRILIAEDDFASRKLLLKFMSVYGECDVTVDGMEAIDAYLMSLEENDPYEQGADHHYNIWHYCRPLLA